MHFSLIRVLAALGAVIAVNCFPAVAVRAQAYYSEQEPSLQGHVMAGYSAVSGNASANLQGGWIFDGGLSFWPLSGPLGIRVDLSYSNYGAANENFSSGYNHGWGDVSSLAAGVVFRPRQYGSGRFYGLAEISGSDVQLRLRQYSYGPFASPACFPPALSCPYGVVSHVNDYGASKFGWNVGLGVDFPTYWGTSWFIEGQWRRVQTPQPFDYCPVTVGLRFYEAWELPSSVQRARMTLAGSRDRRLSALKFRSARQGEFLRNRPVH